MSDSAFLLVDDEKPILDALKDELRRAFGPGYVYETAESVAEAWDVIDELVDHGTHIVVVVSDWLMPDVRGDAFLVELRARHPDALRIMLTGHAASDGVQRARELAAVHEIVSKPWDGPALRRTMLISHFTAERLRGAVTLRAVDVVRVKGKTQPVELFEVTDALDDGRRARRSASAKAVLDALAAFRAGRIEEARRGYARILEADPDDGVARVFVDRCLRLLREGVPAGFDGITTLDKK